MADLTIQQTFRLACERHWTGRLNEAERLYRQVLAQQPDHIYATHGLGALAAQVGKTDIAVDLLRRVVAINPKNAEAYSDLGNVLRSKGELDEAISAARQAILLNPNLAAAHNNLGNALEEKGRLDEAIAAYHQTIILNPNLPEVHNNLGNALRKKGRLDEAISAYRRAIALNPNVPDIQNNLGDVLQIQGNLDEAIAAYRKAIALAPNAAESHARLGNALLDSGQVDQAIDTFRRAISLKPQFADAHNDLGNALKEKGMLDEAVAAYRQAFALKPEYAQALSNCATALAAKGKLDEAIDCLRRAIALNPNLSVAHSNLILYLHYHPRYDTSAIADELRRWNQQHAEPLREFVGPHSNDPNPQRRLRIGYVSADFRDHVVGRQLLPLLEHHDRQQFEITCYAHVDRPDAITAQFQHLADRWCNIAGLSDEQAAEQIRKDQIDILVDLALHTAGNRLLVFARKPASVQVTYLAYAGSSGMSAMDYRLSDPYLDPPNADMSGYSEKTVRLPHTYWCYQPDDTGTDPAPTPALQNGFITFGCLNNFIKVSPAALDLWTQILMAVPNSRLILHASPGTHRDDVLQLFERGGVAKSRLSFVPKQSRPEYIRTYSDIDIALDPFPFNGGVTTCDALWMEVPVITLSGNTAVARGGKSILTNIGLTELVAPMPQKYLQIAIDLSNDIRRLQHLRQDMRRRMLASPLMGTQQFAKDIEAAFRHMWHAWCATASAEQ